MPIQIDHIDTTIEIAAPSDVTMSSPGTARSPTTAAMPVRALGDVLMSALADEFLRYARSRGH